MVFACLSVLSFAILCMLMVMHIASVLFSVGFWLLPLVFSHRSRVVGMHVPLVVSELFVQYGCAVLLVIGAIKGHCVESLSAQTARAPPLLATLPVCIADASTGIASLFLNEKWKLIYVGRSIKPARDMPSTVHTLQINVNDKITVNWN